MISIYIIASIAVINANHMQHELDQLQEHYDAMVDIALIKYGRDCQVEIHDLMNLLCDGFQYCPSNENCMDKTEYQEFVTNYCNSYEEVDYSIQINPSNQHTPTYTSLEIQWTFLTTDGCTRKVNEHHKMYYNDQGLITRFYDEPISDNTECPQSGYDSNTEPIIEYPQETVYQDEYRREYSNVQIAEDDPARLLFNEVTNPTELVYIEADLDKLQDQIAEIASTDFVGMSLSEAYSKDISENTIRYICLIALEEVGPEDGIVLNIYIQYDVTKLAHAKNNIVSGLIDHFGDVLCKSKAGKAADGIDLFCIDAEYDAICDNEADDDACAMFAGTAKGRDGVLQHFKQYEDLFDEATSRYDSINDRLITSYRKGSCQGEYSQRVEFEYDEARQCISKWTEFLGDIMTSDKGCHNSAAAFNYKILNECKFDDEMDNEYIVDEPSSTVEDCQNNVDGINKYFETMSSIDVGDCNTDNLMDLLSVDFTENYIKHGTVFESVNKDGYKQEVIDYCRTATKFDYALSPISCNSVTVEWELTLKDGCVMKKMQHCEFVFDYQGLINRLDFQNINNASIICLQSNGYNAEPSTTQMYTAQPKYGEENNYGEEPLNDFESTKYLQNEYDATKLAKNNIVAGLVNHFGDVLCKSKQGKASDEPNVFCTDIEYEGICDNDADDDACAMFAYSIAGRDGVLQYLKNYEDIFDEATSRYDSINDRLITSYRKGLCQGEYSQRVEFEYDEARQCISKWAAHLGDIMASDAGCNNSAAAFNRKIMTECKFDDEIDNEYIQEQPSTTSGYDFESTTKYSQNEYDAIRVAKNDIVSALVNHFGDILCKSKAGKAADGINLFCIDVEYDAICDEHADGESCIMFARTISGRDKVLQHFKEYEDIFDEATSRYDSFNDRLITSYRKGSCQGEYSQKVEFEYDEARQCISKWIEHLGETMTSDKGCHNSAAAFNRKILEGCKFDDEIDNGYIKDEPSTTSAYESESGFDALVKGNEDCEPITATADSGSPMLRKKGREMKMKAFYKAAFDCELKVNQGNTQLLDTFMDYLSNSVKLCIIEDNACYDKDEIREGMVDRYLDDNELIDYQVEIISNDACKIESKCVSQRRTPKGCMVIKEEYDTCLFNNDGSIKEFTVNQSNRRVECDYNDNE